MASRNKRQEQASSKKRDAIMPAPSDEPDIVELTGGTPATGEVKSTFVRASEESVLEEDFKYLELSTVGGFEAGAAAKGTLAELQRGFAIDLKKTQGDVDAWNSQLIDTGSTHSMLDILQARRSYETPWVGQSVWYPEECASAEWRFDQPTHSLRVSDMVHKQTNDGVATVFEIDAADWSSQLPEIATDRKDAHIIVAGINLCSSNTKGLPYSCEVGVWSGTSESGHMREWHTPGKATLGSMGPLRHAVVEPCQEFRTHAGVSLYGGDLGLLCNPWMSRFMTFDFTKFATEVLDRYVIPKMPTYLRIKAPIGANFKDIDVVQWFALTFFRFLSFATRRQMAIDKEAVPDLASKIGGSVIQARYEPGAKPDAKPTGYEIVITRASVDKVLSKIRSAVRSATVMAKLDRMALTLSFVGGAKTAENIRKRMMDVGKMRDSLEKDKFVGPLSFTIQIQYIAIPASYPGLEAQSEANTGTKFRKLGSVRSAAAYDTPAPSASGTSGKFGTHSARASVRHSFTHRVAGY